MTRYMLFLLLLIFALRNYWQLCDCIDCDSKLLLYLYVCVCFILSYCIPFFMCALLFACYFLFLMLNSCYIASAAEGIFQEMRAFFQLYFYTHTFWLALCCASIHIWRCLYLVWYRYLIYFIVRLLLNCWSMWSTYSAAMLFSLHEQESVCIVLLQCHFTIWLTIVLLCLVS